MAGNATPVIRVVRGLERNLDLAADPLGCEHQVDRATELLRNEIADDADEEIVFIE